MNDPRRERAGWAHAGAWALVDRGLFSASNFLVSLLLARWLSEAAYGSFALALAAFLLAGALHGGWITEPMLVYGPSRYKDRFAVYLGYLLRRHGRFSTWVVVSAVVLAAVAVPVAGNGAATTLIVAGVATPFILLQWLGRLACYASIGPRRAAFVGLLQIVLVLGGLMILRNADALSTPSAFALLGLVGGLLGAGLLYSFHPRRGSPDDLGADVDELHRSYGGWAAGTGLLTWIPGQVYYLVLSAAGAVAAAGNLRALINLVLPLQQSFAALSTVLTSSLARARTSGRLHSIVLRSLAGLSIVALGYAALLLLFGARVMHWLYAGRYDELAVFLPLVAWLPVVGVAAVVLVPALRALEQPNRVFVAYVASTLTSLSVGLWLTLEYGVGGAAVGQLLTTMVTAAVLTLMMHRSRQRRAGRSAPILQSETAERASTTVKFESE